MCQSQQPQPNLTHGAALRGAKDSDTTSCQVKKKRASFGERAGAAFAGGRICECTVLGGGKGGGLCVLVCMC